MNLNVLAFDLQVSQVQSKYDWFEGDPSSLRQMSAHRHRNLKRVKISSFCPQKSMVELARHVLENATSLECLTLDTTPISYRCSGDILDRKCPPLDIGPCSRCYAL